MNASIEPATTRQVEYLKVHGVVPDRPLTKSEAVDLIRNLFEPHGAVASPNQHGPKFYRDQVNAAWSVAECACTAETAAARQAWEQAAARREEFWMDTCRDASELPHGSAAAWELYRAHGCLFCPPARSQAQAVLAALDASFPQWDEEQPELFYETLKLNFPELSRRA